ncbi:hypothetical protein AYO44_01335 [Planctomycetaceae bacterium SCGC AG-212-F19]|nr:hypothetical protein AYO44_01335 [Planctomycetaceae bacterium SCGC AG-212-F19]
MIGLRVIGPEGSKATFFPDSFREQELPTPAEVSVRPGYIYHFRLANLPQGKDAVIYPTVEVIGALQLPPPCCARNYPLPIVISEDDVDRVLAGAYITKLIVLEHPDRAVPVASEKDRPMETKVHPHRNLLEEGWLVGRPMAVVRIGGRQPEPMELHAKAIPGTMLLKGEQFLGVPALPPCVPYRWFRVTDPYHGLRYPEEECLKDGGDVPPRANFDKDGQLVGLDPKDTLAEYTNSTGARHISVSNRVCVCVPRYLVVRTEIAPEGVDMALGPTHAFMAEGGVVLRDRVPPLLTQQVEGPELLKNHERPQVTQEAITPITYEQWLSTGLAVGEIGPKVTVATCAKKCEPPDQPLLLCKSVDCHCTEIGQVVTFMLKYANPGGQPIRNIVVSDSLTGRLEYVPGSAKSDRDAVLTTQENEAGSLILRWQLNGDLPPGQGGVITFQAKIR